MKLFSTRNNKNVVNFQEAILNCVPEDGGLYVPAEDTNLQPWIFHTNENTPFHSIAGSLTTALLKDEFSPLISEAIAVEAFPFSPELRQLDNNLYILELFNGPTGCHKDFGISYLASCLEHILLMTDKKATILAMTNGETGTAITEALRNKKNLKALLLFERGTMRGFTEEDCIWNGGNIYPVEINGSEEDIFKLVRQIFSRQDLVKKFGLTCANNLNIGRIIPQSFFYTYAFSRLKDKTNGEIFYSLSAGNYGNLVSGLYSWKFSLPVTGFITNKTSALSLDLRGKCQVLDSIVPLQERSATDPVNPSNIERLEQVFQANPLVLKGFIFPAEVSADDQKKAFQEMFMKYNTFITPEAALAYAAAKKRQDIYDKDNDTMVLIARDHPSLYAQEIKHWCGEIPSMPEKLLAQHTKIKPQKCIEPNLQDIIAILQNEINH